VLGVSNCHLFDSPCRLLVADLGVTLNGSLASLALCCNPIISLLLCRNGGTSYLVLLTDLLDCTQMMRGHDKDNKNVSKGEWIRSKDKQKRLECGWDDVPNNKCVLFYIQTDLGAQTKNSCKVWPQNPPHTTCVPHPLPNPTPHGHGASPMLWVQ